MRKLFIFFTIAVLTISTISCSSDDNNTTTIIGDKELYLKVSRNYILENETVLFGAFDADTKAVDADFYVDNVKVSKEHKFEKRGIYIITAKKAGYKVSNPLAIQVIKDGEIITNTLILAANKYEVFVEEPVIFNITDGNKPIEDSTILFSDGSILGNYDWTPTKPGTYKFTAIRYGFFQSNEITVIVKQRPIEAKKNFTVNGIKYQANETKLAIHSTEDLIPIRYTDSETNIDFYVFSLYIFQDDPNFISFSIRVNVDKNTKGYVLPQDAKKEDISNYRFVGYANNTIMSDVALEDIALANIKWGKKFVNGGAPGEVEITVESKDKKTAIDYSGEYAGLLFEPQQKQN